MLSFYLLTTILFGVVTAAIGRGKGRSFLGWLLTGLLIGPFGLIVLFLPAIPRPGRLVRCPGCDEAIPQAAQICRYCRTSQV